MDFCSREFWGCYYLCFIWFYQVSLHPYQPELEVQRISLWEVPSDASEAYVKVSSNSSKIFVDKNFLLNEEVWVEVPIDIDGDRQFDLVHVENTRSGKIEQGLKDAEIIDHNSYKTISSEYKYFYSEDFDFPQRRNIDNYKLKYGDIKVKVHSYDDIRDAGFLLNWLPAICSSSIEDVASRIDDSWVKIGSYHQYFLSSGYIVMSATNIENSSLQGLLTIGDYNASIAMAVVINSLNGRVRAYLSCDEADGWKEAKCNRHNGHSAICGKFHKGSHALQIAAKGVGGLETIILKSLVVLCYDYSCKKGPSTSQPGIWQKASASQYFTYVETCGFSKHKTKADVSVKEQNSQYLEDIKTGDYHMTCDYNDFWDHLNMIINDNQIRSNILLIFELSDTNVRNTYFSKLMQAAQNKNLTCKACLQQGGHKYASDYMGSDFFLNFQARIEHYLYGASNGIVTKLAHFNIQDSCTLSFTEYSSLSLAVNKMSNCKFLAGNNTPSGRLDFVKFNKILTVTNIFSNDIKEVIVIGTYIKNMREDEKNLFSGEKYKYWSNNSQILKDPYESLLVWSNKSVDSSNPFVKDSNGLVVISEEQQQDVCLSGTSAVNLKATFNENKGIVSTRLVDCGEYQEPCVVYALSSVPLCKGIVYLQKNLMLSSAASNYHIVSTGSIDVQNVNAERMSLIDSEASNYVAPYAFKSSSIELKTYYNYSELLSINYIFIFKKSYCAAVIILSVDRIICSLPSISLNYKFGLSRLSINLSLCIEEKKD
ncbi:MAG: hypothetical protein HUJ51_00145 [Eggerthellaceae bacterium]|nr:hypothetical protein [Eggerthellaceae bacterium]